MGVISCEHCHADMVRKGPRHRYCARCARDRELRRLVRFRKEEAAREPVVKEVAPVVEVTLRTTTRELRLSNGEEFVVIWAGDMVLDGRRGGLLPLWPQKNRGFTP